MERRGRDGEVKSEKKSVGIEGVDGREGKKLKE